MMIEGKTHIRGKRSGSMIILIDDPKLKNFIGKDIRYTLDVHLDTDKEVKSLKNRVHYTGRNRNKHLFGVTSGNSGDEYLVDISFGCGCPYGSIKGVSNGRLCSHTLSVLKYIVMGGQVK